MKRSIIFFLLLLGTLWCNAQTKKETEDWLTFYLNKFIGFSNNIVKGQAYADSYSFDGDSLVISKYNEFGDSASWKVIYVNLRKVIKVEISIDTTFGTMSHIPCFKIWLYFDPPQYPRDTSPVSMVELYGGKSVRYTWSDPYELAFGDYEILEKNMPERIQKAVTHLVTLDHGKIIKEVF